MALIKTRPNVRLLLPHALVAGQVGDLVVELLCDKPVPVGAVSLTLTGDVVWFTSSQYGRQRNSSRFLDHQVPLLSSETELAAGEHRLRTSVSLGHTLPGSHDGERLRVEYRVKVHVDIPWWPDKRVIFAVRVANTPTVVEENPAMVFVSHAGGPPAKGPYLELALGQRSVVPGGTMRISAALGNVDRNRYRKLHVDLVARETVPHGLGQYEDDHIVNRWAIALDDHPGELQPIAFAVQLPTTLVPGFELHGCKLRWLLHVHADVAWGVDPKLRVPIRVRAEAVAEQAEFAVPLAVGSERQRLIWSNVAHTTGLEFVDDRLRGVVNGVAIELHRGHDQEGPARTFGRLEFPDLGVGLTTHRERRTLLGVSVGAIETGLATRDPAQTACLHAILGERFTRQLVRADFELLGANDRSLRFALDAAFELVPLREFAVWLVELAPLLATIEASMPAPAVMAEHAASWVAAARRLGAQLRRSDLRLVLVRDELRLVVGCDFDDEGLVRATHIELEAPSVIPTRHHLIWTGDTALPDHELPLAELVKPPQWQASGIGSGQVALHISAQRVCVLLPAPLPDPLLERDRIEALFAFGRMLRGDQGPYR